MAVSHHKLSNIINCSGCHLPFNFNNSVPKSLPCKHWFCLACLEDMISKSDDFAHFECVNCQQTIDVQGLNATLETLPQPTITTSSAAATPATNSPNATTHSSADIESQISLTRSASIASDNSKGCTTMYFTNNNATNNGCGSNASRGHLNVLGGHNHHQLGDGSAHKMSPGENCIIHGMPNTLWCNTCDLALCRGCNAGLDHKEHLVQNHQDAKESYQNRMHQDIMELQNSLADMEQLNRIQKEFLLNILEGCCALKSHLENELAAHNQSIQMDAMKEMLRKLQMHLELLQEQNPNDFVKLDKVIRDEKQKFRVKHKELLRQYAVNEVISTNDRLLDFQMIQQIFQRSEQPNGETNNMTALQQLMRKPPSHNPILHLTNYCVYHLYISYTKQKQQFFEDQLWRYQQYQQQIIANFKTHQSSPPPPSYNNNNNNKTNCSSSNIYDQLQYKRKTYAEIANSTAKSSLETSSNSGDAFDLFNGPLTVSQYKQLEEVGKCIDLLLLNPISNDNNHIYYFDFERNGEFLGRVLIKVYASYAPKMSYNFHALCTNEKGVGYRGCRVFKCYPNQSIITGDIDQNNGYGSRSIYEEAQFVPDDTKIPPFIGAVGMRRAKKIYDSQCLVGSQFRIILKVRPFSAIFGRVIEGLEVVWNISQMQVQNDKMSAANMGGGNGTGGGGAISVAQCGVYEFVKRHLSGAL